MTTPELAEALFNAYNECGPNPWKSVNGGTVPSWKACGDQVQGKWRAAAEAARVLILSAVHDDEDKHG